MTWRQLFSLFVIGSVFIAGTVSAQDTPTSNTTTRELPVRDIRSLNKTERDASKTALEAYRAAREEDKVAKIIAFGQNTIDERIAAIEKQSTRITENKCSTESKAAINENLTAASTLLIQKKTELSALTTVADIRALIKDVFESRRTYSMSIPATLGACHADRLIELIDGKLAEGITKLKTNGLDTSKIDPLIVSAREQATIAKDAFLEVAKTPSSETAKTKLTAAKTALDSAKKTLSQVKVELDLLVTDYRKAQNLPAAEPATVTP